MIICWVWFWFWFFFLLFAEESLRWISEPSELSEEILKECLRHLNNCVLTNSILGIAITLVRIFVAVAA